LIKLKMQEPYPKAVADLVASLPEELQKSDIYLPAATLVYTQTHSTHT
jgi:hypothetical protein